VVSSRSNTRIPDPDGIVAALEPIAGSQVWHAGGTAVRAELQDAISKIGPMAASAVSRTASFVFFLLDETGRTGLGGRHSTTRVAVVSAARLPAHDLAPDVAEHPSSPFDDAVVARSEIGDKAGGSGRLLRFPVLAHWINCSLKGSMRGLQAGLFRPSPGVHFPGACQSWPGVRRGWPRKGTVVLFLALTRNNYWRTRSSLDSDIRWTCARACSARRTAVRDRCRAARG